MSDILRMERPPERVRVIDIPEQVFLDPEPAVLSELAPADELTEIERRLAARRQEAVALEAQLAQMLDDAHDKALKLLEGAKQDARQAREAARAQGYDDGMERARQEFEIWRQAELERIAAAIEAAASERARIVAKAEVDIARIAMAAANRLVARQVDWDEGLVTGVISELLEDVGSVHKLVVRVSAEDFPAVQARMSQWQSMMASGTDCELTIDHRLQRGDAMIETDFGTIDGRLQVRTAELESAVLRAAEG
ncbi:MAG: FliH/SctL family protein [Firmicutes bacterium]|nr:FliH/SctL family protein [Bacillota bacterium]